MFYCCRCGRYLPEGKFKIVDGKMECSYHGVSAQYTTTKNTTRGEADMKKGLNRWSIIGNVGGDPEVRYTSSGIAVANFSVAINSSWKDADGNVKEQTEWVNVVFWKKLAEIAGEWVRKGSAVFIEGRGQTSSYEKDGVKKYKTELVADNLILLGGKQDGSSRVEPGVDTPPVKDVKEDDPLQF
jgi:single-strand DNA-binding protein